jgi:hypothetical protein
VAARGRGVFTQGDLLVVVAVACGMTPRCPIFGGLTGFALAQLVRAARGGAEYDGTDIGADV